jgi:hypothetical protein
MDSSKVTPSNADALLAIAEAFTRVGARPEERLGWLVDFARREAIDPKPYGRDWNEVQAFVLTAPDQIPFWRPDQEARLLEAGKNRRLLLELSGGLKAAFEGLARDRRLRLPFENNEVEWRADGTLVLRAGGDLRQRFNAAVVTVLMAVAQRLAICQNAECQAPFAKAGKAAYCSPRCSQHVRTKRFRATHPEKVRRWRRKKHVKKQRARYGPNVRVKERRSYKHGGVLQKEE